MTKQEIELMKKEEWAMKECRDCPELIERYGYCLMVEDWVEPRLDRLSFDSNYKRGIFLK